MNTLPPVWSVVVATLLVAVIEVEGECKSLMSG